MARLRAIDEKSTAFASQLYFEYGFSQVSRIPTKPALSDAAELFKVYLVVIKFSEAGASVKEEGCIARVRSDTMSLSMTQAYITFHDPLHRDIRTLKIS